SGDTLHDSARLGAMLLPGMGFTRASWVADSTMKGVPWMFSAGSNQVGTSDVCTAHVIWPSGPAPTGGAKSWAATAASSITRRPGSRTRQSLIRDLLQR